MVDAGIYSLCGPVSRSNKVLIVNCADSCKFKSMAEELIVAYFQGYRLKTCLRDGMKIIADQFDTLVKSQAK